ncbi:MAG: type II secretion system F family protein [Eubacteriales bacterium]
MVGIITCGIIIVIIIIFFLISMNYDKEELNNLNKKEYPLHQIMPMSLFLMDKILKVKHRTKLDQQSKEKLTIIYGQKDSLYRLRLHMADKIALSIIIIFCVSCLGLLAGLKDYDTTNLLEGNKLKRPEYNEGTRTYNLQAKFENDGKIQYKDIEIPVNEQKLSLEKTEELFDYATKYIDKNILGENKILTTVQYPLKLFKKIPNTKIEIKWISNKPSILDEKGTINYNEVSKEGTSIILTAIISHEDYEIEYIVPVTIYPLELDLSALIEKELQLLIEDINSKRLEETEIVLPETLSNKEIKVEWEEPKSNTTFKIFVFGIFVAIIIFFIKEEELKNKVELRNQEIRLDFPEFVNKLTLLVCAGMTITKAWGKIVSDYRNQVNEESGKKRYLYEEAKRTWFEIQGGNSELVAYENFGKRCKLPEFMKFSSLIVQNMRKGTNTLIEALREQSEEAWQKRKDIAKILGERASTKLLIPMMLMLLIVLVIIMIPAFMSMSI